MRLFFETGGQANAFLFTLPLGFLLALFLDVTRYTGHLRPVLDVCALVGCALTLLALILFMRDQGARLFHILAIFTGAILYICGVGRLLRCSVRRIKKKLRMRKEKSGKCRNTPKTLS